VGACVALAIGTALAVPGIAAAAPVQVNKTGDHDDSTCTAADCTLREAIVHSNAGDVVSIPAGTYTLSLGELTVSHNLTINGAGASSVKIDGANASRVLEVALGDSLTLSGVTIQHGKPPNVNPIRGGGIRVLGNLTLRNSTLTLNQSMDGGALATDDNAASATLDHVNVINNGTAGIGGAGGIEQNLGSLTITSSLLSNNHSSYGGAGSLSSPNAGDRTVITDTTVSGNSVSDSTFRAEGGGFTVDGSGTVTITRTKFTGNTAQAAGALYAAGIPKMTVTDSTLSGNHAVAVSGNSNSENGSGGAFIEDGAGKFHFVRTTISGNTADQHGGGIFSIGGSPDFTVSNSTIANNKAGGGGGGVRYDSVAHVSFSNTTIAGNSGATGGQVGLCDAAPTQNPCTPHVSFKATIVSGGKPVNCAVAGGSTSSGGSNIDSGKTCAFSSAGDKSNTNPKLGPLASNGGLTQTEALLTGSPAINAVVSGCPPPTTDQRGVHRPQGSRCDIGSYELKPPSKGCKDRIRPKSKIDKSQSGLQGGVLTLHGTASDKGCKGKKGHVAKVTVTIARHITVDQCKFLLADGHSFGPVRACDGRPPFVFKAHGKAKWSLKLAVTLPKGNYTIRSLAVDKAGNRERVGRLGKNVLTLHLP
jgi:CSLREA domain-containing protein